MTLDSSQIVRALTITVVARPQFSEAAHLPVRWVGDASDGERLAEYVGRLSTMSQDNPARRSTREYLSTLSRSAPGIGQSLPDAHLRLLDHVNFTLLLDGVSRSLADAMRRRVPALHLTEVSPRFLDDEDTRYVLPPACEGVADLEMAWSTQVDQAYRSYRSLVDALMTRYGWVNDKVQRRRMARDGAESALPASIETKTLITASLRTWRDLIDAGTGESPTLELRRLAVSLTRVLIGEVPALCTDLSIGIGRDQREMVQYGMPTGDTTP